MSSLLGMPVQVSPHLPIAPSPGEVGRRIVRHGLADVLRWLGEKVGPAPDEVTEMVIAPDPIAGTDTLFVSREVYERMRMGFTPLHDGLLVSPLPEVESIMSKAFELRREWIRKQGPLARFAPRVEPFRSEIRDAMIGMPVVSRQDGPLRWQL